MQNSVLTPSDEKLESWIEGGEADRVEFKEDLKGSASIRIREAICAFANDLPRSGLPGIVVLGLRDNGSSAGIPITDQIMQNLADMGSDGNIVPPPTLSVQKRLYKGEEIAVVTVLPSDSPPVRYKGTIFVRTGPRRSIANAQDERILNERRNSKHRPFDVTPVPGTNASDLSDYRFNEEYLPRAVDRTSLSANERSSTERLAATKMIASVDDERATILGLMILGVNPRDFIPGAYVQFLRIDGSDFSDPIIDERAIDGTAPGVLTRLEDTLRSHNFNRIDIVSEDTEQRKETYPFAALQQLVRNAIMHRDYETTNAPVRVTWFGDRIEIQNPGGPFGVVSRDNFAQHGITDYRNPNLAESMRVLGYVQRFGVGIPTAQRLLREAGHPKLEFTVEDAHVLATVKSIRQVGKVR